MSEKILSFYELKQVVELNDELRDDYLTRGYKPTSFVEVGGKFEDKVVPNENFAKTVFSAVIKEASLNAVQPVLSAIEDNVRLDVNQHEWLKSLSMQGHPAIDTAIVVAVTRSTTDKDTDSEGKQPKIVEELLVAYYRVEIKDPLS